MIFVTKLSCSGRIASARSRSRSRSSSVLVVAEGPRRGLKGGHFRRQNEKSYHPLQARTPSGSASCQLAGWTLSRSCVLCSSMGDTPISTRVLIMLASRDTTASRSACVDSSPDVVGKSRPARAVQESCQRRPINSREEDHRRKQCRFHPRQQTAGGWTGAVGRVSGRMGGGAVSLERIKTVSMKKLARDGY